MQFQGTSGLWGIASLLFTLPPTYLLSRWEYTLVNQELRLLDKRIGLMQEMVQAIQMIKMMASERFWFKRVQGVRDAEYEKFYKARLINFSSALI